MILHRFLRLSLSLFIGLFALTALGAVFKSPARAAATVVRTFPDVAPCNTTLQACIDASAPGDVIQIKPGVYVTSVTLLQPVSLIGLGTITPTLLMAPLNQRVMTITSVVITASTVISNLHITGGRLTGADCVSGACGGGIYVTGGARPTLSRLTIENNTAYQGGGLWAGAGSDFVLADSKLISNSAAHAGGGLYSESSVRLINSVIERNQSSDNGGGLEVVGSLEAVNTVVVSNTSNNGGGGARVAATATLNFGRWEGNATGGFGGGLFASDLIMTGTLFINNEGNGYGGGVYINGSARTAQGKFERNRALGFGGGGGLYATSLRADGTHFISNTANGSSTAAGGGAYVGSFFADLTNVRFENNTTMGSGGGLWASGPVTLANSIVFNNSAEIGSGGGVYASAGLLIKDSRLENNVSQFSSGGGAYAFGLARIGNSDFVSNSASFRGGGVVSNGGADVQNSQFLRNRGAQSGGGLDVEGAFAVTSSVFISNTANIGGGIFHNLSGDGRVVNSLFARNDGSAGGAAALHLASSGHVDVLHTTMADPRQITSTFNPNPAVWLESGSLNVTNTLLADHAVGINNVIGTAFEDYNLFSNVGSIAVGLVVPGGNDQYPATPQFVNPLTDNYHLLASSAAIDNGTDAGLYFDIDGQPRPIGPGFDIGYDEYGYSIQLEIDRTAPGGMVFIPSGEYTESLTLYKPVSLIGLGQTRPIIHAAPNQRVITITGAAITASTVISNLELTGGDLLTECTQDCLGGGVLITDQAQLQLVNVFVHDNWAMMGGGVYVQSGGAQLTSVQIDRNRAGQSGGGLYVEQTGTVVQQAGGSVADNQAVDGAGVFVQNGRYHPISLAIANNNATNWGGGVIVGGTGGALLEMTDVYSNQADRGGGVFIDLGGVELLNGTLYSNTAGLGGGLYLLQPSAVFTLTSSQIDSNRAITAGGGLLVENGLAYLNSGLVQTNEASMGGGIAIGNGTVKQQAIAYVVNNTATLWGGGVYLALPGAQYYQFGGALSTNHAPDGGGAKISAGTLTQYGGLVSDNTATSTGGGVLVHGASSQFIQLAGVVQNNTASDGGGVYVQDGLAVLSGTLVSNAAGNRGGGVFVLSGQAVQSGSILSNVATFGGGVYVSSSAAAYTQTQPGQLRWNKALSGPGGGLYVDNGLATLIDGQIISNTAGTYGGGIAVGGLGSLRLSGQWRVAENTANGTVGGGGLFVQTGGRATLLGGRVDNNRAVGNGGGLYAWSDLVVTGTKFFNNTAQDGGAIYHNGTDPGRLINVFVAGNTPTAANANGASVSLNSTGAVSVAYATFGNAVNTAANVTGRAIEARAGDVKIVNSIVASYSVGISATAGTVTEDYNLFFGTPVSLTGSISSGGHSRAGLDPQFVNPLFGDYHVRPTSPAINRALDVGVRRDIDFDGRPIGGGYDVGADETLGAGVVVTPGGNLTTTLNYTGTTGGSTNVIIPPAAITGSITGTVNVYYSTISTASITTPLPSRLILSGDPFELDAFSGDELNATPIVTFSAPVTITIHYTESELGGINEQTLKLYRLEYPPFGTGWCAIGVCRPLESQTLDVDNNIITATVLGFSKWGKYGAQYPYDLFLPIIVK